VDLLLGTTSFEGDFFMYTYMSFASTDRLRQQLGPRGARIADGYRARHPEPREAESHLVGDWVLRMPTLALADQRAQAGRRTWLYQFDWQRSAPAFRPTHGSEGPFIFGTGAVCGFCDGSDEVDEVTRLVQAAWVSFARTGCPADPANGPWQAHTPGSDRAYTLRRTATVETGLLAPVRELWELGANPGAAAGQAGRPAPNALSLQTG